MSFPSGLFASCPIDRIKSVAKAHCLFIEDDEHWREHTSMFVPETCAVIDGMTDLEDDGEYKLRLCRAVNDLLGQCRTAGIIDDLVGLGGNESEAEYPEEKRRARIEDFADFDMNSWKIRRYSPV